MASKVAGSAALPTGPEFKDKPKASGKILGLIVSQRKEIFDAPSATPA
jgi:hypothetical protein